MSRNDVARCFTRDGRPVADHQLPAFSTPPAVVIWGDRVFVRRANGNYYEAFAWVVVA